MGTGKPGRILSTEGNGMQISEFALVHSDEGTLIWSFEPTQRLRLASGGHGQNGIAILDRHGIEYNIVKTYPNGVRVGNVPDHKNPLKRTGTGQSWFPESWTSNDIRQAGEYVAGLEQNSNVPDGKTLFGVFKEVRVGVIRTNGKIATVFPDSDQTFDKNK